MLFDITTLPRDGSAKLFHIACGVESHPGFRLVGCEVDRARHPSGSSRCDTSTGRRAEMESHVMRYSNDTDVILRGIGYRFHLLSGARESDAT
jgi:hypothetical protein